jgi:hypothetical protein
VSDPLDTLIKRTPTAAVVTVVTAQAAYSPGATYVPGGTPTVTNLNGLFWKVSQENAGTVDHEATLSVRLADLPVPGTALRTRVLVDGVNYFAAKIRKRMWKGVQNGWTFLLKQ